MDGTFHHRNNLLHRSHPPGTLLDQFLHLIPTEKKKCFMNTGIQFSQEKYLSVRKAIHIVINLRSKRIRSIRLPLSGCK